jgi:hypothetical protein
MRGLLYCLAGSLFLHQTDIDGIGYLFVYRKLRLASLKSAHEKICSSVNMLIHHVTDDQEPNDDPLDAILNGKYMPFCACHIRKPAIP